MGELSAFQDALSAAIGGDDAPIEPWLAKGLAHTPGLAVYRNTVARGAIDALVVVYSTVVRMVGEEWFRAAAKLYADEHRPTAPSLLHYGADFPDWLARFPPAQDAPYLSAIARLDRLWWDCYFAADGDALDAQEIARLQAADLEVTILRLNPSVRLAAFNQNLASLWLAHRQPDQDPGAFDIGDRAEQILIVRDGLVVQTRLIDRASYAFLSACAAANSLLAAASAASAADPEAALPSIIGANLEAGVFSRLDGARQELCHGR